MTFNPYTRKFYIASGSKVLAIKIEGQSVTSYYTVAESSTQAITYYKNNAQILMANDLNTDDYFAFMIGKFASHKFNKSDDFYVEKSSYVEKSGYTKIQDIYYNGTNGLFIATNFYDTSYSSCKNRILRVNMNKVSGTYNGKNVYAIEEVLDIDFDTDIYTQCNIESMALDKYGRLLFVCNATGNGGDALFRVTDYAFKRKTSVDVTCTTTEGTLIPNKTPKTLQSKVTYLTGMALHGDTAYYIKSNSASSGVGLYTAKISDKQCDTPILLEDSAKRSFGMTYYNNYLYISFRNEIRQYSLKGNLAQTYTLTTTKTDAIAHIQEKEFVVMDYKPIDGKLCLRIWELNNGSIIEKDIFYVVNDDIQSYGNLQDIYYHPLHGLYICICNSSVSCKNLILRIDLTYYMRERQNGFLFEGETVPVSSKWYVDFSTTDYANCNIESAVIADTGKMVVACNVTKGSNPSDTALTDDGTFTIENITFRTDRQGIYIDTEKINDLPSMPGMKCVPACLAINGRTIYCITTNTSTNCHASNYSSHLRQLYRRLNSASPSYCLS